MKSLNSFRLVFAASSLLACAFVAHAEPLLEKIELFKGGTNGYASYRIPGLVATAKGTLLAYCEARRTGKSDWDAIDILMRRSSDGGKTWDKQRKIADVPGPIQKNPTALKLKMANPNDVTYNNPVAIAAKDGRVHFLFCVEYMRCFYMSSKDDGQTFTKPVEITAAIDKFRSEYPWKVFGIGPGHGIQLQNGRLLVPLWLSKQSDVPGGDHRPSCVGVIFSDDGGTVWQRGDIVANDPAPKNPNESVLVELADGSVLINMRHEGKEQRRAVSISKNGSTGWSKPVFQEELLEPICFASLLRVSAQPKHAKSRLLFSNPANLEKVAGKGWPARKNLTFRLSYDEGKTWPVAKSLDPGSAGYSDLAAGPDGTLYCLYEHGLHTGTALTLVRFNLEWLTAGKDNGD